MDAGRVETRLLKSVDKHFERTKVMCILRIPAKEADRSIPKSRGGNNTTGLSGNLQPTCTNCNRGPDGNMRKQQKNSCGVSRKRGPMIEEHTDSGDKVASKLVKIGFVLPFEDRDQGVEAENLWAVPIGGDLFCLDNIPFYVYGVSLRDVVIANEIEGRLRFRGVADRSGHSTYRVLVKDTAGYEDEAFQKLWDRIRELGCLSEVARRCWIAIDVPPDSDVFAVYRILEQGDEKGVWTFEEGHCGHPKVGAG